MQLSRQYPSSLIEFCVCSCSVSGSWLVMRNRCEEGRADVDVGVDGEGSWSAPTWKHSRLSVCLQSVSGFQHLEAYRRRKHDKQKIKGCPHPPFSTPSVPRRTKTPSTTICSIPALEKAHMSTLAIAQSLGKQERRIYYKPFPQALRVLILVLPRSRHAASTPRLDSPSSRSGFTCMPRRTSVTDNNVSPLDARASRWPV
jgi:hypothetical protein